MDGLGHDGRRGLFVPLGLGVQWARELLDGARQRGVVHRPGEGIERRQGWTAVLWRRSYKRQTPSPFIEIVASPGAKDSLRDFPTARG
jgi:hypothetical protein